MTRAATPDPTEASRPERDPPPMGRWFPAAAFGVAAAALGAAVQRRDGLFDPPAFFALTLTLVAAAAPFLFARRAGVGGVGRALGIGPGGAAGVLGAAVAFQFFELFTYSRPGSWHADTDFGVRANPRYYAALAAAALAVAAMFLAPRAARLLFLVPVVVFLAVGVWIIRAVPVPVMDVWVVQTEGVKAILRGHNPYDITFPDVYGRPDLYAPGAVRDGQVHLGFPYPPLVLLIDLPGFMLAGDFRYSNLAAAAGAALLMAWARPRTRPPPGAAAHESRGAELVGPLAATLFLLTPRAFLVIESGWTEPSSALLVALLVFCGYRFPKATPAALGLFLVSKQYLLFAIAPAWLLLRRATAPRGGLKTRAVGPQVPAPAAGPAAPTSALTAESRPRRGAALAPFVKLLGVAALVGSVVSLPLILWDVRAFLESNFLGAARTPFRADALSYLALYAHWRGGVPPAGVAGAVGFAAALVASGAALARGPRGPGGYAGAVGFIYLVFFALNKFAFCNYYYFVLAAFCAAAAAAPEGPGPERGAARPAK